MAHKLSKHEKMMTSSLSLGSDVKMSQQYHLKYKNNPPFLPDQAEIWCRGQFEAADFKSGTKS